MRSGTFHFSERVSFGAAGYPWRVALSPLRSRGCAASLSCCGGARFHAAGRSGDLGPSKGSVSLRARTWRDRAGIESTVPGRPGSREARANGNGTWHTADVRGFRGRETGGAHFRKIERAQGAGIGSGDDQRASNLSSPGSWDRTAPCDEPFARPSGGAGQYVWRKSHRLGGVECSASITGCGGLVGKRGRTGAASGYRRASDGSTRKSRIVPDGPRRPAEYRGQRRGTLQRLCL